MNFYYNNLKLKPSEEGDEGGNAPETDQFGYVKATEEKVESKSEENVDVETKVTGYEEDSDKDETKVEENSSKDEEDDVETKATGYEEDSNEDSKKDETKVEEEKKTETEEEFDKTLDSHLGELSEDESSSIKKFAKEHKLTSDQVKAYAEMRQSEIVEFEKNKKEAESKYRKDSTNELKSDKDFGGENFNLNLKRVEVFLENHLPNTKKTLTDRAGMLPPYLMKDLLKIRNLMNSNNTFVGGDPSKVGEEEKNVIDIMYK